MRRFEAPGRFWQIQQDGAIVRMQFGKTGTRGNRVERDFGAKSAAAAYVEQQVEQQRARGYHEVTVTAARIEARDRRERFEWMAEGSRRYSIVEQRTLRVAVHAGFVQAGLDVANPEWCFVRHFTRREEADREYDSSLADVEYAGGDVVAERAYTWHTDAALEAQCDESRDAPGPWSVLTDALLAHGDLRGELAALVAAGKHDDAIALLDAHGPILHGNEFAKLTLDYRYGFVVGAAIDVHHHTQEDLAFATAALLRSPLGRFVERLRTGLSHAYTPNDWAPTVRAIAESPRAPYIRSLRLDAYEHADSEFERTGFGDLSPYWSRLPVLEELRVRAGGVGVFGTLALPKLQAFAFEHANPRSAQLRDIVNANLPSLTSLELWLGSAFFFAEASVAALGPLLEGSNVPALVTLHLHGCRFTGELIAALAGSALLPRLASLALVDGSMAHEACEVLIEHARAFAHLQRIDLTGNHLTTDDLAALAVLPNVHAPRQRRPAGEED